MLVLESLLVFFIALFFEIWLKTKKQGHNEWYCTVFIYGYFATERDQIDVEIP